MEYTIWTNSTCTTCGKRLGAFGTCPDASPRDCATMTAPVNCGKRHTPGAQMSGAMVDELRMHDGTRSLTHLPSFERYASERVR